MDNFGPIYAFIKEIFEKKKKNEKIYSLKAILSNLLQINNFTRPTLKFCSLGSIYPAMGLSFCLKIKILSDLNSDDLGLLSNIWFVHMMTLD